MKMGAQTVAVRILGFLLLVTLASCNTEGDILYAQKQAWSDPDNVLASWNNSLVNPCTWMHVTCNNNSSVVRIDLGHAGLSGVLISQLGGLTNMQYLELQYNNISGAIPDSFGNLTNLISLDLQFNMLSGSIPASLGNLYHLNNLNLNGNNLSGSLPVEVLSLVTSGSLIELNVANNSLSGKAQPQQIKVTTIMLDMNTLPA